MIKRDSYGIICQHHIYFPENPIDGGDSASRTGIMALCRSIQDRNLLSSFITDDKKLIRHPNQPRWNDPKNTSRDQLIPFLAGCWSANAIFYSKELSKSYGFWINKDFLDPAVQLHIQFCAGNWNTKWKLIGFPWLRASIFWATKIKPSNELNQILCMCIMADVERPSYLKLLCESHPDWRKNVTEYWSGWRDQKEIGEAFIECVEQHLKIARAFPV